MLKKLFYVCAMTTFFSITASVEGKCNNSNCTVQSMETALEVEKGNEENLQCSVILEEDNNDSELMHILADGCGCGGRDKKGC